MTKVALVLISGLVVLAVACGGGGSKSQAADSGDGDAGSGAQEGSCPTGCDTPPKGCAVKGNILNNEKQYLVPGQPFYGVTTINPAQGEKWFCTEDEARNNGWTKAN